MLKGEITDELVERCARAYAERFKGVNPWGQMAEEAKEWYKDIACLVLNEAVKDIFCKNCDKKIHLSAFGPWVHSDTGSEVCGHYARPK